METPKNSMLVRADARAYGMVTSTTTRASERWAASKPEDRIPTSACISYKLDEDGNPTDAKVFRAARKTNERTPRTVARKITRADRDYALLASLGLNNSDAD